MRFAIEDDVKQDVELVRADSVYELEIPKGAKVFAEVEDGKWQRVFVAEVNHAGK